MIDRNVIAKIGVALIACAALPALAQTKALEKGASTEGLDMQEARAKMMGARGAKVAYTKKFDLSPMARWAATGRRRFASTTPTRRSSGT
jgi:hypothetical protein